MGKIEADKKFMAAVRLAIKQLIKDRDTDMCELVMKEVEDDLEFGKSIKKSMKSPRVSEESVMKILKGDL